MNNSIIIILTVIIFLSLISKSLAKEIEKDKLNDLFVEVTLPHDNIGVILPQNLSPLIFPQCSRVSPTNTVETWQVKTEHVYKLEKTFPKFIALNKLKIPHGGLLNYYRQYIGIFEEGRKYVYVNGFHKSKVNRYKRILSDKRYYHREKRKIANELSKYINIKKLTNSITDWRYWIVNMCDGGDEYFGAYYDIETHKFVALHFSYDYTGVIPGFPY